MVHNKYVLFNTLFSISLLAHELAKDQKLNFGDDIASALRAAKKKVRC